MKKLLSKCLGFLVPLCLIVLIPTLLYIDKDVHSDFGDKDNYSWKYNVQSLGDISTKKLLTSPVKYNSFILGSSRTAGVYACYLEKKITDSKFLHYTSWSDPIEGIYKKLKLVDSLGYPIDNVIMYLDTDYTFKFKGKCRPNDHYLVTGDTRAKYLFKHYQSFFSRMDLNKVKILLGAEIEGEAFPNWESDVFTNDYNHKCSDSIIATYGNIKNPKTFKAGIDSLKTSGFFYERPKKQTYQSSQISNFEHDVLLNIKALFKKHKTNYYIVITPLYSQLKFSDKDMKIIEDCFKGNVYDFSGKTEITDNIYNYPDKEHFTTSVSKHILDSIIKISPK